MLLKIRRIKSPILSFILLLFTFLTSPSFAGTQTIAKPDSIHFLSMADIHFDPFSSCANTIPCPIIEKLRNAPASAWPAIFAQYDTNPSQYRQDTNYSLLTSALAAAKKTGSAQNAQFVLMLGDFLGHNYKRFYVRYTHDRSTEGYQAFVHKTLTFLTNEIAKTFPIIDVYCAVGNNDSYRRDYESIPHGQFFSDVSQLWSSLIKNPVNRASMQKTFSTAGYYSVDLPENVRLIVLNTNLFSNNAKGTNIDQAANDEWNWFHNQLVSAQNKQQKVFVALHIPDGIDVFSSLRIKMFRLIELWQPSYTQRFKTELQTFAPNIAGIFAGHLHADWFQVMSFEDKKEIPVSGTPSISPIFGNNPGFKIYIYSPKTQQLENFVTYFNPLNKGAWSLEYNFNHVYQSNCHDCPITAGMDLIQQTGLLSNFYRYYYSVSTYSQPIAYKWDPYYWCALRKVEAQDYKKCLA